MSADFPDTPSAVSAGAAGTNALSGSVPGLQGAEAAGDREGSLREASVLVSMAAIDAMRRHAVRVFPAECCGVVLGRMVGRTCYFVDVVGGSNLIRSEAASRFQLDWETLLAAVRYLRGGDDRRVAFYHSHTDGSCVPSALDTRGVWPWSATFIVPVRSAHAGEPVLWLAAPESA